MRGAKKEFFRPSNPTAFSLFKWILIRRRRAIILFSRSTKYLTLEFKLKKFNTQVFADHFVQHVSIMLLLPIYHRAIEHIISNIYDIVCKRFFFIYLQMF